MRRFNIYINSVGSASPSGPGGAGALAAPASLRIASPTTSAIVRIELPQLAALLVALLVVFVFLDASHPLQLDALRKMASYKGDETSTFTEAQTYLNGLRDALIPLALPLGAIGLTGGGVAYMMGNVMAQKILGGVVIGLALTLMAPTLVA